MKGEAKERERERRGRGDKRRRGERSSEEWRKSKGEERKII